METKILEQIGLSKNEIKVYFALLELDQSSATPIVKKANIPNSKVYPILDKLIKKGLVSFVIKNQVKYFQASDPHHLIDLLTAKEKDINAQKQEIEKIIPQIELQKKLAKEKQETAVYEGLDGVKAAFGNILNTLQRGEKYRVFTLGEELGNDSLKRFFREYHRKRIEREIKVNLIAPLQIKKTILQYHKYKDMQIKYIDLKLPTGIFIYKDKVMTVVWGEKPTAFVIQSNNNFDRYKEFFEEMWKIAKN